MTPLCPICGKPAGSDRVRPFCSPRCADIDLGRWFGGAYAIPTAPEQHDGEEWPDPAERG